MKPLPVSKSLQLGTALTEVAEPCEVSFGAPGMVLVSEGELGRLSPAPKIQRVRVTLHKYTACGQSVMGHLVTAAELSR